ncbi:MAG: TatD family hydrolase [Myxococcaceae bacterium]|nr:TatD family hydrolase [Myxococcaceae bacterium]
MFDVHLQPSGLSDADLETLKFFGVEQALVPAGRGAAANVEAVLAEFDDVLTKQLPRLEKVGIRAVAAFGVHPLSLPRRGLPVLLQRLPEYLSDRRAVAVGAVGLKRRTPPELDAFEQQLQLARRLKLNVMVVTPAQGREAVTRQTLNVLRASGLEPSSVLVDGADTKTVRLIRECGFYAGLTLHPDCLTPETATALVRKLGPERLVLDTAAGEGSSDLLGLARCEHLLEKAGLSAAVVRAVTVQNAQRFSLR